MSSPGDVSWQQASYEKRPRRSKGKIKSKAWSDKGQTTSCKADYQISYQFPHLCPFYYTWSFRKSCLNVPYLSLWASLYKGSGLRSILGSGGKVTTVSSSAFPSPQVKVVAEIIIVEKTKYLLLLRKVIFYSIRKIRQSCLKRSNWGTMEGKTPYYFESEKPGFGPLLCCFQSDPEPDT